MGSCFGCCSSLCSCGALSMVSILPCSIESDLCFRFTGITHVNWCNQQQVRKISIKIHNSHIGIISA